MKKTATEIFVPNMPRERRTIPIEGRRRTKQSLLRKGARRTSNSTKQRAKSNLKARIGTLQCRNPYLEADHLENQEKTTEQVRSLGT
jgi:hypothetical protein